MDIVLIAGLWLDGSAWDSVAARLEARGHRALPVTLPGQGDGNTSATLADQVAAVISAVDAAAGRPMVVGHSAACTLAWLAADARPGKVSKIALIGGFPGADGEPYFSGLPLQGGAMPFPGWSEFEGPDSADLDDAARQAFTSAAIPVPEGVISGVITLADDRRYDVPGGPGLPGVHPGPGQGMDRARPSPRAGQEQGRLVCRYRFRSLAYDQRAGRARACPGAGG